MHGIVLQPLKQVCGANIGNHIFSGDKGDYCPMSHAVVFVACIEQAPGSWTLPSRSLWSEALLHPMAVTDWLDVSSVFAFQPPGVDLGCEKLSSCNVLEGALAP